MMNESEPSVSVTPTNRNLGRILAETRKARGWTIRYAASQLRLPESTLAHLEAEEFAMLPSEVYVKGYLRNYARLLRLPADDIVQAYLAANLGPGPARTRNAEILAPRDSAALLINSKRPPARSAEQPQALAASNSHGFQTLFGAVVVIAAAYGLTWWWPESEISLNELNHRLAHILGFVDHPDVSTSVAAPQPGDPEPTPSAATGTLQNVELQAAVSPNTATNVTRDAPSTATASGSSTLNTRVQPERDTLVLSFRGDSWATVLDADGNRLMNQIGGKGSTRTLTGKAPFKLTIGRVSDVTITMNGELYTLPNAEKRATEKFSVPFAEERQ